jgi:hypothetical protein
MKTFKILASILGMLIFLLLVSTQSHAAFDFQQLNYFTSIEILYPDIAAGDLDGDDDIDLLICDSNGAIYYLENKGTESNPILNTAYLEEGYITDADAYFGSNMLIELVDLDSDGDLDLLTGEYDGYFGYLENTGSATNPEFDGENYDGDFISGASDYSHTSISAADMDDDGDVDLIVTNYLNYFYYLENTGSDVTPSFNVSSMEEILFADTGDDMRLYYYPNHTLADIDGDGDFDIVMGETYGNVAVYINSGSESRYQFLSTDTVLIAYNDSGNDLDFNKKASPALADFNDDGLIDLVVAGGNGYSESYIHLLTNSGDSDDYAFNENDGAILYNYDKYGSTLIPAVYDAAVVTAADIDNDGDQDLFICSQDGSTIEDDVYFLENTGSAESANFTEIELTRIYELDPTECKNMILVDVNDDDLLDIVFGGNNEWNYMDHGDSPGTTTDVGSTEYSPYGSSSSDSTTTTLDYKEVFWVEVYLNVGNEIEASFGDAITYYSYDADDLFGNEHVVFDVDSDGKLDLLGISDSGKLEIYTNSDSNDDPDYDKSDRIRVSIQNDVSMYHFDPKITVVDMDDDGDQDILLVDLDSVVHYLPNTGTKSNPYFDEDNLVEMFSLSEEYSDEYAEIASVAAADMDDDGDLDLIIGLEEGTLLYYETLDIDESGLETDPSLSGDDDDDDDDDGTNNSENENNADSSGGGCSLAQASTEPQPFSLLLLLLAAASLLRLRKQI